METAAKVGALRTGLLLPYFTPTGQQSSFYRVRFLGDAPGGFAMEKPQRYAQPKGSLNEVYLPPLLPKPWAAVFKEVDGNAVLITEGELKAAAACAAGFNCIGLGGVDVWRSGKRGMSLLPQLEAVDWRSRDTTIVFDSDAATNPSVVSAQVRLARELTARGATVKVASLPPTPDGKKQGLDDFLVAGGDVAAVLTSAVPFAEGVALWELNKEIAYIREQGVVLVQANGRRIRPNDFVHHSYSNRYFNMVKMLKGVPVPVKTKIAQPWLDWERRFELDSITYDPGKPQFHNNNWNDWKGWGVEPKRGDIKPWRWLLDFVFKEKHKEKQWFERWLAYPLQHPGAKLFSAACIWGVAQGTGKTLIGHTMLRIYGENGEEVKPKNLKGNFNGWAKNKQFVLGDEITGTDQRDHADMLKSMITQQKLSINIKYLPEYSVPDCVNYLFTSNHPDAFFMEDGDRRFFIHELVGAPAKREEYAAYDKWYKSPEGAAALFHHLLNLNLGDFEAMDAAMDTGSKRAMILDNKSDVGAWVAGLLEDPVSVLRLLGERQAKECDLYTNKQLLRAYDPEHAGRVTACGLGRELKKAGLRQVNGGGPMRLNGGLDRLYAVRNVERWVGAGVKELSDHWSRYFGPGSAKF